MLKKEKIQKVNFGLYPTSLKKADRLAEHLGRSISNLFRWLVDEQYKKTFGKEG